MLGINLVQGTSMGRQIPEVQLLLPPDWAVHGRSDRGVPALPWLGRPGQRQQHKHHVHVDGAQLQQQNGAGAGHAKGQGVGIHLGVPVEDEQQDQAEDEAEAEDERSKEGVDEDAFEPPSSAGGWVTERKKIKITSRFQKYV